MEIRSRLPRESWRNANGKQVFCLEIPFGKFGLPFEKSRFLREFSVWEDQNRLIIYIPTEIAAQEFTSKPRLRKIIISSS